MVSRHYCFWAYGENIVRGEGKVEESYLSHDS